MDRRKFIGNAALAAAAGATGLAAFPAARATAPKRKMTIDLVVGNLGFGANQTRIGYGGPVRAEPFDQKLKALGRDQACAVTAQAMRKAFALIR